MQYLTKGCNKEQHIVQMHMCIFIMGPFNQVHIEFGGDSRWQDYWGSILTVCLTGVRQTFQLHSPLHQEELAPDGKKNELYG